MNEKLNPEDQWVLESIVRWQVTLANCKMTFNTRIPKPRGVPLHRVGPLITLFALKIIN